jgi:O-antigen ligase
VVLAVTRRTGLYSMGVGRYAGLWGNPNLGAFVCLVAFALSVFARRWVAWLGRLTCVPLLYLAASRRGLVFFVAMVVLYALMVRRNSGRFWFATLAFGATAAIALSLSLGLRQEVRTASQDAALARVMDLEERDTMARGGATRWGLLEDYLSVVGDAPWYGYGLQAMAGTQYDEDNPDRVLRKGIMELGTHNTYLGVWVDVGPAGFLAFLLVIGHYVRRSMRFRGEPSSRWAVLSLGLVMAAYLMFSHDLLFVFAGQVAYALLFLLPSRGQLVSEAAGWRPGAYA